MSRSRPKKKAVYTPPPTAPGPRKRPPSPGWVGATIAALFLIGIVWLVLYYTTSGGVIGQRAFGGWNVFVGFAFICGGFGLATRWR